MLIFSGSSQNPGSSVLDELQLSNGLLWKAGEETITIIHPAGDKGMNKFLQVLTGNKTSNSCNVFAIKTPVISMLLPITHCPVYRSLPEPSQTCHTNLCVSFPQSFQFLHRSCSPTLPGFLQAALPSCRLLVTPQSHSINTLVLPLTSVSPSLCRDSFPVCKLS